MACCSLPNTKTIRKVALVELESEYQLELTTRYIVRTCATTTTRDYLRRIGIQGAPNLSYLRTHHLVNSDLGLHSKARLVSYSREHNICARE